MDWLSNMFTKTKEAIITPVQGALNPASIPVGVPVGVAKEGAGRTTTGGKMCGGRRRRTHRGKKSKKTLRRKH